MRVLIVPDKFKGTLTADAAARAMATGWRRVRPGDTLELLPMSDGGEGFGQALARRMGARTRLANVTDAAGRPLGARWWWLASRRCAIVEAAQSNGLALLPPGGFHPFELDTRGVGALIEAALRKKPELCIVGVGGSATNDGGFGMATALGWQFLDAQGRTLRSWTDLDRLTRILPPSERQPDCRFVVATDVDNPLLGPRGASRVYGPQKGLVPSNFARAEACLGELAAVVRKQLGFDSKTPGSGAAGGLGFGLCAFLGAERRLGFDVFAEAADLDRRLAQADLVITGEGSFDEQSLMGKGVGQLLAHCRKSRTPAIILAGRVAIPGTLPQPIRIARGLTEMTAAEDAMARPAFWLRRSAAGAARATGEP